MQHLLRTRFKNDIVSEFLIPEECSNEVVILAPGVPSGPSQGSVVRFLAKKGYAVFNPRYRGTWESGGEFLYVSPVQDILDIIDELPKGFKSAWDGTEYKIEPKKIIIICSSFGGAAGLLASMDKRVDKVIAFAPVVDWTEESKEEPFDFLKKFVEEGFGNAYRGSNAGLEKLRGGEFYNPLKEIDSILGEKIWIFHAKDDEVVAEGPVREFAKRVGAKYTPLKKGGHFGMGRLLMKPFFFWKMKKFLNN